MIATAIGMGSVGGLTGGPLQAETLRAPRRFEVPAAARPIETPVNSASRADGAAASKPARSKPKSRRPAAVHLQFLDSTTSAQPVDDTAQLRMPRTIVARNAVAEHLEEAPQPVVAAAYEDGVWTTRANSAPAARSARRVTGEETIHGDDAFADPFGDRVERSVILAPAAPVTQQLPDDPSEQGFQDDPGSQDLPSQDAQPDADLFDGPLLPEQAVPQPRPDNIAPLPAPRSNNGGGCERIYNDRDCCDEEENCRAAQDKLRSHPISAISLDISPRFNPATDDTSRLPERERTFEEEIRTWRNRAGEIVARGSLLSMRSGRVLIRTTDGPVEQIPLRQLSNDDICYFSAWWGVPNECLLGDSQFTGRNFTPMTFTWKASALCHKPLYFEEVQLERYGHTAGPIFQPVISGAHFFLNIAALPYNMGIHPMNECQYALGYYRPGSCAPWMIPPVPLSVRGALMQAGAVVGGVYVIP